MPNDIRRLKDEADIEKVISYLGIPVNKKGSAYFVLCPRKEHDDTHATNCYFKKGWNHVFCSVCGRATYAVDIIANVLGTDYGRSCDLLWELSGRPSWYYDTGDTYKDSYSITREDARLIGLHLPARISIPVGQSDIKKRVPKRHLVPQVPDTEEGAGFTYLICRNEYCHWSDLLTEKEMAELVINKAKDKRMVFQSMAETEGISDEFKQACMLLIKECDRIADEASVFAG